MILIKTWAEEVKFDYSVSMNSIYQSYPKDYRLLGKILVYWTQ